TGAQVLGGGAPAGQATARPDGDRTPRLDVAGGPALGPPPPAPAVDYRAAVASAKAWPYAASSCARAMVARRSTAVMAGSTSWISATLGTWGWFFSTQIRYALLDRIIDIGSTAAKKRLAMLAPLGSVPPSSITGRGW